MLFRASVNIYNNVVLGSESNETQLAAWQARYLQSPAYSKITYTALLIRLSEPLNLEPWRGKVYPSLAITTRT